jgi:hypothetical protein
MKGIAKLIAGLALFSASFSASANTWADGVDIEVLKVSGSGTFIVSPVGAPVSGCRKFRFVQNVMNLSAQGQKSQYAMALSAFLLGKRVNIFFDANTAECFSGKMELDQLQQP